MIYDKSLGGEGLLLSVEQMYQLDRLTIKSGISGETLMAAAGGGVARCISEKYGVGTAIILCGPGNNGGDGFVVACELQNQGWDVSVGLLGDRDALKGDAALMADKWQGTLMPLSEVTSCRPPDVVVDGLFGAGLARDIEGVAAAVIKTVNTWRCARIAIDIPSGINGDTGHVAGIAFQADMTVTFCRPKRGHVLLPGRCYSGQLRVVDIGIPERFIDRLTQSITLNNPTLWVGKYPWPMVMGHKYSRGHAVVVSGDEMHTGAARLAARAALRIGAGLVTVAAPSGAIVPLASQLSAVMIKSFVNQDEYELLLQDDRRNAWCVGPANGVTMQTKMRVLATLKSGHLCVLDADALTIFEESPDDLFAAIKQRENSGVVLTPHGGEFRRLFPDIAAQPIGKCEMAISAAAHSGAVVVFKGGDTVIAAPTGEAVIAANAPPALATAGSGDVLAGMITGLLAQGMEVFDAACAAVWLHGEAAKRFGPGLIAEDIEKQLPFVFHQQYKCY